jgi:hypothetical protein
VRPVIAEIGRLEGTDRSNPRSTASSRPPAAACSTSIQSSLIDVGQGLGAYDDAFARLTAQGDAAAFREFLLSSPPLFVRLGELVGALNHIATYWRYRFPPRALLRADSDDVIGNPAGLRGEPAPSRLNLAA